MKTILLKAMLAFAGILHFGSGTAQVGSWTWISGSSTPEVPATSTTPGSRDSQAFWADASGNFWVFGGEDYISSTSYNDLWEYSNNQWTRVSDNSTSSGVPSARYAAVGVADHQGNFWIFGGVGVSYYNDLWEYTSNQWKQVSGNSASSSVPAARDYAAAAVDESGNIWLFGGADPSGDVYNDLWKYSTTSKQWTFVSGKKNGTNTIGVYTSGSAAPGARYGHCLWIDASGNIWVFGGEGYDNNTNDGLVFLNDLWEYSPTSGQWTFVSGSNSGDTKGVYGTMGTTSLNSVPGSRWGATAMEDASGNFWIFGGAGYGTSASLGDLDDIWTYNPVNNLWTWVGGSTAINASPNFSRQASANPGGLQDASGWVDGSGNIWIMAGGDADNKDYNDLWEFTPPILLPLTEVLLQGVPRGSGNFLTWQTVNEINTTMFVVERSSDGTVFTDIGSVPAIGSGDNSYSFTDAAPPQAGSSYYRLGMPHSRGDTTYSSVIVLNSKGGNAGSVYPNPTSSGVTLRLGGDALLNTPVKWYDAGGHLVRGQLITSQVQYFDIRGFAAGIYLLQLEDGTTIRIVRE